MPKKQEYYCGLRIGIICGGPSEERGISLNSARSAMDHLVPMGWKVTPIYCKNNREFFRISCELLYSNTPSDFDFKLNKENHLPPNEFIALCREMDLVLPVIHGTFGEDGCLQQLLEENDIPFVGSSSSACQILFNKAYAKQKMREFGYTVVPDCVINREDSKERKLELIKRFFFTLDEKYVVVKPAAGGSSIGIATAKTPEVTCNRVNDIFNRGLGDQAIIEPYCRGREFTILVLHNKERKPVSLIPVEIKLEEKEEIFNFRTKYLPSSNVEYFCPPRFSDQEVEVIQRTAERLFSNLGMRDYSRLDGWILDDGRIIFSDFNPIPDFEQTSFLFIQGSRVGLNHADLLDYLLGTAVNRYGGTILRIPLQKDVHPRPVWILLGGKTAERQVSLESGSNVWLKLLSHPGYQPSPYLLAADQRVWELPYLFALNQSVEEIVAFCRDSERIIQILQKQVPGIRERLGLAPLEESFWSPPRLMSIDQFCNEARSNSAFIFNALHGGEGEDGRIQFILNGHGLAYNGSDIDASWLCMDKFSTGEVLNALRDPLLISSQKICIPIKENKNKKDYWTDACREFNTDSILIKPRSDGCSTGVVRLSSADELDYYLSAIRSGRSSLQSGELRYLHSTVELPVDLQDFILEPWIERVDIKVDDLRPGFTVPEGWIELTVGVLERNGEYHSLSPSITIAEEHILSVEEKFQGGTGVNLTPPPDSVISPDQLGIIRSKIEKAARALGIEGYARIDIFFHTGTNVTLVIEANTLPGLTPSTVIYHQALAENPPLFPVDLLGKIIENGIERNRRKALAVLDTIKF